VNETTYRVMLTPGTLEMLRAVADARERGLLAKAIDSLAHDPISRGKPLTGELAGCRSLRAVGQRFRIIYRVDEEVVTVLVLAVGRRHERSHADIYSLARRLVRLHLLDEE
jgi:mRNA interferase RelE/StbE